MAQPTTAPESIRQTPSEIDALREDARQMDAKFRAIHAARRAEQAAAAAAQEQQNEELMKAFERAAQQRR